MTTQSPRLRPVRWVLAALACLGVALFVVPGHLGLWQHYPFTQLSSMRVLTALGMLLVALVCVVWALRVRPSDRRVRPSTVVAAVALLGAGVGLATPLGDGALSDETPGWTPEPAAGSLTVLSFNASLTRPEDIAAAALASRADALLLVETPAPVVRRTLALMREHGFSGTAVTNDEEPRTRFYAVGVIVSDALGSYVRAPDPGITLGAVVLEGEGPGPARLAAVHPPPPSHLFSAADWREQLARTVRLCEDTTGAIVGGDFNAVADHVARSGLEQCTDATTELGLGARGTWPTVLPAWMGAAIDHQVVDPRSWTPTAARIIDVGASDHRAVVVRYVPAGSPTSSSPAPSPPSGAGWRPADAETSQTAPLAGRFAPLAGEGAP